MELWDLYDLDRNKTGRTIVRGEPIPEGYYRFVVHICIFDNAGRMLIQHRTPTKRAFPDVWDLSAGGAAIQGDDSHSAAQRELYEELGIAYDFSAIRPVLTTCFANGFNDVYCITLDGLDLASLTLQERETDGVRWATEDEILALIDEGDFIPYHKGYLSYLFHRRNHTNVHINIHEDK